MDDVSLRDYIDLRLKNEREHIDSILKMITQHFDLNEKALKKAEDSVLIRLEHMNDFRAQINKERAEYVVKDKCEIIENNMDKRLKALEQAHAFSAGKMWMIMFIFALIPTIISLVALFG